MTTYKKCRDCKYLKGKKSSVGIECINPNKVWRTSVAMLKAPSTKACKAFEEEREGDNDGDRV